MTHDALHCLIVEFYPTFRGVPTSIYSLNNASELTAYRNDNHDSGRDETPQRCKYMGPHPAIATSAMWPDEGDVCGHVVGTSDSTYNFDSWIGLGTAPSG